MRFRYFEITPQVPAAQGPSQNIDHVNRRPQLGKALGAIIQSKLATGKYTSIGEVVREALRHMEERDRKFVELCGNLAQGGTQAKNGEYDEGYSLGGLLNELDA